MASIKELSDLEWKARTAEVKAEAVARLNTEAKIPLDPYGPEFQTFLDQAVELVFSLEGMAIDALALPEARVPENLDLIYVDSGPGSFSKNKQKEWNLLNDRGQPDKDDYQYHDFPWTRGMDRQRIVQGVLLAYRVTSKRAQKSMKQLTAEDFLQHCPTLMYTSKPFEVAIVRQAIAHYRAHGLLKIPDAKFHLYHEVDVDGKRQNIVHTGDQIEGFSLPEGLHPKLIGVISNAPHMLRVLCMFERFQDVLPQNSELMMIPVPTPEEGIDQYTWMEILGTARSIWGYTNAKAEPSAHRFSVI